MRIFSRYILVLSICAGVAACVPLQTEYFKPLSAGKLSINGCGGGPKDHLEVQLVNNISTSIHITHFKGGVIFLHVSFFVPENNKIQLTSDQFTILSEVAATPVKINRIQKIISSNTNLMGIDSVYLEATELLDGSTSKLSNFWGEYDHYEWYSLQFDKEPIFAPREVFTIKYPSILINGTLSDGPLIKFKRKKGVFIYALNC